MKPTKSLPIMMDSKLRCRLAARIAANLLKDGYRLYASLPMRSIYIMFFRGRDGAKQKVIMRDRTAEFYKNGVCYKTDSFPSSWLNDASI